MVKKHGKVKVFHFSGARIEDVNQDIIPIIKNQPDYLIRHVRTNDATTNTYEKIAGELLIILKSNTMRPPNPRHLSITGKFFKTCRCPLFRQTVFQNNSQVP